MFFCCCYFATLILIFINNKMKRSANNDQGKVISGVSVGTVFNTYLIGDPLPLCILLV